MKTILTVTIAGTPTDYDAPARASIGVQLGEVRATLEGYDSFSFKQFPCAPVPAFLEGSPFKITLTEDDGSDPRVFISGRIMSANMTRDPRFGWVVLYRCDGLKRLGDYVAVTAQDGTGNADFNLQPADPDYDQFRAGQSVGGIIQKLLEVPTTAQALHALGIGGYTESSPGVLQLPPALNATTVADLVLMTIVPPAPVHMRGEGLFRTIEQLILNWHPQYATWVRPEDGIIRFQSLFTFTPQTLNLPASTDPLDTGHPVEVQSISSNVDGCYTQVRVVGLDIQPAYLKYSEKTLYPAWTLAEQAAWTIANYNSPTDSSDQGAILSCTSNSCVVRSDYATAFWATNFWNARQGQICLVDTAASGINIYQYRDITSCTAMTPGGTATITWDASLPISSTSYNRYQMLCNSSPASKVWREFWISEPSSCTTSGGVTTCTVIGANTWVGSHLEHQFPNGVEWATNGKIIRITGPSGVVIWSQSGTFPFISFPLNLKLDTVNGKVVFNQPVVVPFSDPALLVNGSPTTFAQGLPVDIQAVVPYNLGDMVAQAPAPGTGVGGSDYSGTAYSRSGLERVLPIYRPEWNYRGNTAAYITMAEEHLATVQEVNFEGSLLYHLDGGAPSFDLFSFGYALNLAVPGTTATFDGIDMPVRSISLAWPDQGPDIHTVSLEFSNRRRPWEGDDLLIHPAYSPDTFGVQQGSAFVAGPVGGMMGMVDLGSYNQGASAGQGSAGSGWSNIALEGGSAGGWGQAGKGWSDPSQDNPDVSLPSNDVAKAAPGLGVTPAMGKPEDWGLGRSGKHLNRPPKSKAIDPDAPSVGPLAPALPDTPPPPPRPMTLRERRGVADDDNANGGG